MTESEISVKASAYKKIRFWAAGYFAVQGIAVVLWWLILVFAPSSRKYFGGEGTFEIWLTAFWLPDLMLIAIGSIVVAGVCFFDSRFAESTAWFVTGAVAYASIYCFSFALATDTGWLGVALMLPSMLWSGVFSFGISSFKNAMFRQSKPARTSWILTKTLLQIIIVWGLILFVIPPFIVRLEEKIGFDNFYFPYQKIAAVIFFVSISLLGLSSAYTMSKIGRGTPLPLDSASQLVVAGVYKYVRNPMAISGIGQGLAVALWHGSLFVAIYALMGGAIWQLVFRPLEEGDLQLRFGEEYEKYRKNVSCWIPRIKPYKP
ncbi:MAG: isoprenylcysteine carboxylmethyltransferase family protein [Acidobacteriota bacterium]|nr:isoprenylcysteine carboxylmethyltransferase family protein [Acidobacteriota bacterium]